MENDPLQDPLFVDLWWMCDGGCDEHGPVQHREVQYQCKVGRMQISDSFLRALYQFLCV